MDQATWAGECLKACCDGIEVYRRFRLALSLLSARLELELGSLDQLVLFTVRGCITRYGKERYGAGTEGMCGCLRCGEYGGGGRRVGK